MLDEIFGKNNFRNEITWSYTGNSIPKYCFPKKHDIILWYSKTNIFNFYPQNVLIPYSELTQKRYNHTDEQGRRYKISALRDGKQEVVYMKEGKYPDDVWAIPVARGKERTGYPTQKPLALLNRIIQASSNEGDIVMDPFCGCATTCVSAQQLGRK
jgi:site-specific DNA-methyltransferase (adenine-specific)